MKEEAIKRIHKKIKGLYKKVQLQNAILDDLFPKDILSVDIKNFFRLANTRLEREFLRLGELIQSDNLSQESIQALFDEISILHRPKYLDGDGKDVTLTKTSSGDFEWNDSLTLYQEFQKNLEKKAEEWSHEVVGTPFQDYILELLFKDDNPFNKKALRHPYSKIGESTKEERKHFIQNLRHLFDYDLEEVINSYIDHLKEIESLLILLDPNYKEQILDYSRFVPSTKKFSSIESSARDKTKGLGQEKTKLKKLLLSDIEWGNYLEVVANYLYGLNMFNLFRVYQVDFWGNLFPVKDYIEYHFEDIIGYEKQKQTLKTETRAFLEGEDTNNIFIYGPPGTGKSSSVNALLTDLNELRLILMEKHQAPLLETICSQIKESHYRFIIVFDELSYAEGDQSYKHLQEAMEGVVHKLPDNSRIYAIANTRYPVMGREERGERIDSYNALADRFGIKVHFDVPDAQTKREILAYYLQKNNITRPVDKLMNDFERWCQENDHLKPNGRNIRDYVKTLRIEPRE